MSSDDRVRALELALEHNRTLSHVGQADSAAEKIVHDADLFLAFTQGPAPE
jgi:hypothetical protein